MEIYAVRIFVKQWPEACEFYGETLGLEARYRNDEIGWAEYSVGAPCLGIERVQPGDAEGEALVGRLVGISLHVKDIAATYEDLKAKGVDFVSPPEEQFWGGKLAHFKDPDGNVLTLLG